MMLNLKKILPWIFLVAIVVALSNCKKVQEPNTLKGAISAQKIYQDGDFFVLEEPELYEMPVLAENAPLTAKYICELLKRAPADSRDTIEFEQLRNPVNGIYMGHDSYGQMSGLEYGEDNRTISKISCLPKSETAD